MVRAAGLLCDLDIDTSRSIVQVVYFISRLAILRNPTALRNHLRIVSEGISSWTALTMYLGMKTTFKTKYM